MQTSRYKIPVHIQSFFWVTAGFIAYLGAENDIKKGLICLVVILFSLLLHEFGHALSAVFFGQRAKIDLVAFGGVTTRTGPKLPLWKEFIVVLNGPMMGIILIYISRQLLVFFPESFMLAVMLQINLTWTLLNLLPVQPLDGGHLLSIVLEGLFGVRGVKIALFISMLLALSFTLILFVYQYIFLGAIFALLTFESYRAWKNSLSVTANDQSILFQGMLKEAEKEYRKGNYEEAVKKFSSLRNLVGSGLIYTTATQYLAEIFSIQGRYQDVYQLLAPVEAKLTGEWLRLLQQSAYHMGMWEKAINVGDKAYLSEPTYGTALTNALCYSIKGDVKPAIGWLQRAIRDGLPNIKTILKLREFDYIRNDPLFIDFSKKILGEN